MTIEIM